MLSSGTGGLGGPEHSQGHQTVKMGVFSRIFSLPATIDKRSPDRLLACVFVLCVPKLAWGLSFSHSATPVVLAVAAHAWNGGYVVLRVTCLCPSEEEY